MTKYKKSIRNLFEQNINQMWFNAQNMERIERKNTIAYIISLSKNNCSFIDYGAKYFLAKLIHDSEPYFNPSKPTNKVKEFYELGWYIISGKTIFGDPIYSLDFEKVMN